MRRGSREQIWEVRACVPASSPSFPESDGSGLGQETRFGYHAPRRGGREARFEGVAGGGEASRGARTTKRPSDGLGGGWGGQRSRRARDHALGRNRGLRWERSVGRPGRAEVVSPCTLGSVRTGRPAGATSRQAPVDLGAHSTVRTGGVTTRACDGRGNLGRHTLTSHTHVEVRTLNRRNSAIPLQTPICSPCNACMARGYSK